MPPAFAKGSRGTPEITRKAILLAAMQEFATQGLAGARTDAIAKVAKVNKALLYYYFRDKEGLYEASLHEVFGGLLAEVMPVLDSVLPPGQKLMKYALTHFKYVATHPEYRRLVQQEMMRASAGTSPQFAKLMETFLRPLMQRVLKVLEEGINSGEFRPVQPTHFMQSMIAVVTFYFVSVPVMRALTHIDPLSPEALGERRAAMLDFISGALFQDQKHGRKIVAQVIAESQSVSEAAPKLSKGRRK